ncbi:MAG: DsbA family protein [Lachnospiraceae bacterium]|nr:DsbA family protein [Lachnospiraceae bacterium]
MKKLQMFFDYSCPYCLKGYGILSLVLEQHPDIEVEWMPCEAHPRPEVWDRHSDLLAAGMYVARDLGADLLAYHELIYHGACVDKVDIEEIAVLKELVKDILDAESFGKALEAGAYQEQVKQNNREAWVTHGFPAVPSFRYGVKLLPAVPMVGVTKERLEEFLEV